MTALHGRIAFEGAIPSKVLGTNRIVHVYLPPSYDAASRRRYPVLYVQDGQNAFSTAGAHAAFGWGNWQLDQTADDLSLSGRMQEIIIVAVDCSPDRYAEYRGPAYPKKSAEAGESSKRSSRLRNESAFERYSRFLMKELKPKIDREYRTRRGPEHHALLGSSMGGICSLALAWDYPKVFGKAASLSGAFQVERRQFLKVLRLYDGSRKPIRIYLDSGVIDYTGDDDGKRHTDAVAQELRRMGWRDGIDLEHYVDAQPLSEPELARTGLPHEKWKEAQTSQHNEFYWRLRAWRALTFLFPPKKSAK